MEQIFGRLFITSLMSHTAERNFVEFIHYTFLPKQACSKGLNDVSRLSEKISFIGIIYEFCRGNLSPIHPFLMNFIVRIVPSFQAFIKLRRDTCSHLIVGNIAKNIPNRVTHLLGVIKLSIHVSDQ